MNDQRYGSWPECGQLCRVCTGIEPGFRVLEGNRSLWPSATGTMPSARCARTAMALSGRRRVNGWSVSCCYTRGGITW